MSNPRIALVAEGETDTIVIEAALKAFLGRPFLLTVLQPEPTRPDVGGGWGGVFKWCQEFRTRGASSLEGDPTLRAFDMIIVHLDVDVAWDSYQSLGGAVAAASPGLAPLPCNHPCPPLGPTVTALEFVLRSWLGISALGPKSLFCLPSQAIDSWLAAAVLPPGYPLLNGIEYVPGLSARLSVLPKTQRIKKSGWEYRARAGQVTTNWPAVRTLCGQAAGFEAQVTHKTGAFPPPP